MSEPQAPVIEDAARWPYEIKPGYTVHLTKPTESQLLVLLRLLDLVEERPADAVRLYGDALDALMDEGESFRCQRGLIKGDLEPEDFSKMGPAVIRHFYPEEMRAGGEAQAPKHGPTATRRPKAKKR